MEFELVVSSPSLGESNFHLQLTPAYRADVFEEKLVRELTLACVAEKLRQHNVVLAAYGFGPDHLHLFVCNVRWIGEIELARQIKGFGSYMMCKHHAFLFADKLWGDKFWSEGTLNFS